MKNINLELFHFRKKLDFERAEIAEIVEKHMQFGKTLSELASIDLLNKKLHPYTFDPDVRGLLETLNTDIKENQMLYDLKHLYYILSNKNEGMLLRQPMSVLHEIILEEDEQARTRRLLEELSLYNWVPEIKNFLVNLMQSPEKKANLTQAGEATNVYTLVHPVQDGHVAKVLDAWFYLSENGIEKTLLENHIKDESEIRLLRTLEIALNEAVITEDRLDFKVAENLVIGFSPEKKSTVFINGDEMSEEATLESIFQSAIVPIIHKNAYPVLVETRKNLDKFMELDIVKRVTSNLNPYLEVFAFNYGPNIYLYKVDKRYGSSFYKYENATVLIEEIKSELGHDLTYFYENKVGKELVKQKRLQDQERQITLTLEELSLNIEKLKVAMATTGDTEGILESAMNTLKEKHSALSQKRFAILEKIASYKKSK